MAPITSSENSKRRFSHFHSFLFFIVCLVLVLSPEVEARQSFEFTLGDQVHVLSDKAFRRSKTNMFEAVGNVIITHKNNAIYGEKASLAFGTGDTNVIGNVRYIGPTMTLYGSELNYNFKTNFLSVQNARILSDNYVVLGKQITRPSEDIVTGIDAEYTTCQDCPESWSIFGKRIHITVGEYIRIWHAFIKVKGVVVMYFPYIILPIKKKRETGLLFPSFGVDLDEGARFKQPWFWAISDHTDMTLAPTIMGKRGWGNEFQFRQMLGEKNWYEFNTLTTWDRIYEPNKEDIELSGTHAFRHVSDYEHHATTGIGFNHHVYYNMVNDLDVARDYDYFSNDKILGTETGGGGFLEFRSGMFDITTESYFNRNTLFPDPKGFDHRYVQILPEINVSSAPWQILQTSVFGFNKIALGVDADFTYFKQNHLLEQDYIRNAMRYNLNPYANWNLGRLGPVDLSTKATLDYQHYRFPYEQEQKSFTKRGVIYETEASVELEKIFGLAYKKEVPVERVKIKKKEKSDVHENTTLIGDLPEFMSGYAKENHVISRNSYRHSQVFKVKHYFLSDQSFKGNEGFRNQIQLDDGQFDAIDAIREKEHTINNLTAKTSLPLSNTVEVQWNNSIIKKKARKNDIFRDNSRLRDNFEYSKLAFFDISQGYDLNIESEKIREKLTRLFVQTGFTLDRSSFRASDYYFYNLQKHLIRLDAWQKYDRFRLGVHFVYDPFSTPINKATAVDGEFKLSDLITLGALYDYDIEKKRSNQNLYRVIYSPMNNCWKLELAYNKTITERRFSFNFLVNFNENSFKSLSDL